MDMIAPHGGTLIDRLASDAVPAPAAGHPEIEISDRALSDVEMIASGAFSPLTGFFTQEEYLSALETMRLPDGTVWPIPVLLPVDPSESGRLPVGERIRLTFKGATVAVLKVTSVFRRNRAAEASKVYGTSDGKHPGVARMNGESDTCVGGELEAAWPPRIEEFAKYRLRPRQARELFRSKGWTSVVGFQTRNPIHRAHEYITKCALETVDGLLIHPLVGSSKPTDIPPAVRMRCYEALIENYYSAGHVVLAVNPANMIFAGPREAVLHAIVRQNFGCTHFIVGRDHAGVGGYYGKYEAQDLIRSFSRKELAIEPFCFADSFWCRRSGGMATEKTSNSAPEDRVALSGSELRKMLAAGKTPPPEFTRPEVAKILMESMR